ncbi:hypothetical protein ABZV77_05235 [Streptomyces sp. NPDC004732]|uniref:hypothetical protein n=1 Tax=Streptomyces sp. NPDC004732 TaxID=3154290 RepID=UPI0033AC0020
MTLPRTYWCHFDHAHKGAPQPDVQGLSTEAPGEAVSWIRESVRDLVPTLAPETFDVAWSWLGNHPAVHAAVRELRRGKPYQFALKAGADFWTWTVYPVSRLPLAEMCVSWRKGERQVALTGHLAEPP